MPVVEHCAIQSHWDNSHSAHEDNERMGTSFLGWLASWCSSAGTTAVALALNYRESTSYSHSCSFLSTKFHQILYIVQFLFPFSSIISMNTSSLSTSIDTIFVSTPSANSIWMALNYIPAEAAIPARMGWYSNVVLLNLNHFKTFKTGTWFFTSKSTMWCNEHYSYQWKLKLSSSVWVMR